MGYQLVKGVIIMMMNSHADYYIKDFLFYRPDGDTEGKTIDWFELNGFFQVQRELKLFCQILGIIVIFRKKRKIIMIGPLLRGLYVMNYL